MLDSKSEQWALMRFAAIAPLLAQGDPRPLRERIAELAAREWPMPDGTMRKVGHGTVEAWYYAYRRNGLNALQDQPRSDKGTQKCIGADLAAAIDRIVLEHPRLKTKQVIRLLRSRGILGADGPSKSSLYRYVKPRRRQLAVATLSPPRERRAFEAPHPGALWQADIMYGPKVPAHTSQGRACKRPTYLVALLDDHSRLCVHGQFYFSQGLDALTDALETACQKRGVPERLYVDNGLVFSGSQLRLICARIGTVLSHTRVRDAAAKGKIERLFGTVRTSFLNPFLELTPPSGIEALNSAFLKWVEEDYHRTVHSALAGQTPMERWLAGASIVRLLPTDGSAAQAFLLSAERTVRRDGTFAFQARLFETDYALAGRKVQVRWRLTEPLRLHVYDAERYVGVARLLDRALNARLPRRPLGNDETKGDRS
jgi:transposase InsO family protein